MTQCDGCQNALCTCKSQISGQDGVEGLEFQYSDARHYYKECPIELKKFVPSADPDKWKIVAQWESGRVRAFDVNSEEEADRIWDALRGRPHVGATPMRLSPADELREVRGKLKRVKKRMRLAHTGLEVAAYGRCEDMLQEEGL